MTRLQTLTSLLNMAKTAIKEGFTKDTTFFKIHRINYETNRRNFIRLARAQHIEPALYNKVWIYAFNKLK